MRLIQRSHLLLMLSVAIAGCGGPHNGSVTGTVTLGGKPLTIGAVTFTPVKDGPLAIGSIQPDGSYTAYVGTEPGIDAGEYRVTVAATLMPEVTPENTEPLPKLLTPARYTDPNTSGLKLEVKPGSNRFDISLDAQ